MEKTLEKPRENECGKTSVNHTMIYVYMKTRHEQQQSMRKSEQLRTEGRRSKKNGSEGGETNTIKQSPSTGGEKVVRYYIVGEQKAPEHMLASHGLMAQAMNESEKLDAELDMKEELHLYFL